MAIRIKKKSEKWKNYTGVCEQGTYVFTHKTSLLKLLYKLFLKLFIYFREREISGRLRAKRGA